MEKPGGRFDHVIIADNYLPRIEQIAGHLRETGRAESIDKIQVDRDNPFEHLKYYNNKIREVLADQQRLLVVHNFYVGLKNGYLGQLQQAERETEVEAAKRLVISCISRDKIRFALNRMGAPLVEIVNYNKALGISIGDLEMALDGHEDLAMIDASAKMRNYSQAS